MGPLPPESRLETRLLAVTLHRRKHRAPRVATDGAFSVNIDNDDNNDDNNGDTNNDNNNDNDDDSDDDDKIITIIKYFYTIEQCSRALYKHSQMSINRQ